MDFFAEPLTKENIDTVIAALLPYEHICVNLADCLRRQKEFFDAGKHLFAFSKCFIFFSSSSSSPSCLRDTDNADKTNSFVGIILLSVRSVLLHCFPARISQDIAEYIAGSILHNTAVACVMGEKNNSIILEELINTFFSKKTVRFENYHLLTMENKKGNSTADTFYETACSNLHCRIEIIKPQETDAGKICPMEMDYMQNEVLAEGEKPSYGLCLDLVKTRIRKGFLAAAKKEDTFIAKAVINASGFFWKQIGGVYTLPRYRNCGAAAALVCRLMEICDETKTKSALFVKTQNHAALRLYEKIGFIKTAGFRIAYF